MFSETDLQYAIVIILILECLFRYSREDGSFGSGNVTTDKMDQP